MDGPGTLTWEEFVENAESFVEVSKRISDGWELRGDKNLPAQAYLYRRVTNFIPSNNALNNCSTSEDDDFEHKFDLNSHQDPFEAPSTSETPLTTEHHVLWSMSYSVPVLYFNGWKSDFPGINPITAEEAQAFVGTGVTYMQLSQAIHPLLGTPFLQFHPCMSQELLQNVPKSKNKLVSWLSSMAPNALNLKIRPEYCELTF